LFFAGLEATPAAPEPTAIGFALSTTLDGGGLVDVDTGFDCATILLTTVANGVAWLSNAVTFLGRWAASVDDLSATGDGDIDIVLP
jgi:hypothetical protein